MEGMMTRNEAAKYLGVTKQTITNWCDKGLLGSCRGEHQYLYVNKDDVERYAHNYKMMAASERMLDNRIKELQQIRHQSDEELVQLRQSIIGGSSLRFARPEVAKLIGGLYTNYALQSLTRRESELLEAFLIEGAVYQDIADRFGITRSRCWQLIIKACNKVTEDINYVADKVGKLLEIEDAVEYLKSKYKTLQIEYTAYKQAHENSARKELEEIAKPVALPAIFQTKFDDKLNLSVRARNCLRSTGISTVVDLLTSYTDIRDLKAIPCVGNKTIIELEDVLEMIGLADCFILPGETKTDYTVRMIKKMEQDL